MAWSSQLSEAHFLLNHLGNSRMSMILLVYMMQCLTSISFSDNRYSPSVDDKAASFVGISVRRRRQQQQEQRTHRSLSSSDRPWLHIFGGALGASSNGSKLNDDTVDRPKKCAQNKLIVFGLGNIGSSVAQKGALLSVTNATEDEFDVIDIRDASKADQEENDAGNFYFDKVYGTIRSLGEGDGNSADGIQRIKFEPNEELTSILPHCTHVLVTIPPLEDVNPAGEPLLVGGRPRKWKWIRDRVLNRPDLDLRRLLPGGTWIGFVSSTAVYGNHDGQWVYEESPVKCLPGSKGHLYYEAEQEWREAAIECGWTLHVFRCAGMYGNDRSALHTVRRNGGDVVNREQLCNANEKQTTQVAYHTSRIHEEDICEAILASMVSDKDNQLNAGCNIWNLSDDNPAPREEVMSFAKKMLQEASLLPCDNETSPPINKNTQPQQSERQRRRMTDRKRVGNNKMKSYLLPNKSLLYPTYKHGLRSILNHNKEKWTS